MLQELVNVARRRVAANPLNILKIVSPAAVRRLLRAAQAERSEVASLRSAANQAAKAQRRRDAFFINGAWKHTATVSRRRYESYADYLHHQAEKLQKIHPRLSGREDRAFNTFIIRFQGREDFRGPVLCLGARLGTEVRALHTLGFLAIGIDLNPGQDNKFVLPGDFHALQFPDKSFATVYTNCLDHVFDMERFVAEAKRILQPGGALIIDALHGYDEGFVAGAYEAMHWPKVEPFLSEVAQIGGLQLAKVEALDGPWTRAVMREASTNAA